MSLSIIIPAYNEAKRLGPFLASIIAYDQIHSEQILEVIVVDDGSTDRTVSIAQSFEVRLPKLSILRHKQNRGKGAAVQTGVMQATGEYIVFMDADGATAITELPKMIQALNQAQIGVGNRWMPGSQTDRHSLLRKLSGWVYRQYMSLFGLGDVDTMCGFKGYRRAVALDLFKDLIEERWLFDTEIAYKAIKRNYTVKNFPIKWESQDGSKLDTKALIKIAFQIWPLIHKIKN